jgi:hypothetical protein
MALQAAIIFTSIRSVPIESIFSVLKDGRLTEYKLTCRLEAESQRLVIQRAPAASSLFL